MEKIALYFLVALAFFWAAITIAMVIEKRETTNKKDKILNTYKNENNRNTTL